MSEHPKAPIPLGLRIIAVIKLATATLLAAASIGFFRNIDKDMGEALEHIIMRLHIDPENRVIEPLLEKLSGLDAKHIKAIGAGTMCYAILYYIEGVGLWLGKHWAEYLVIIITASLLPIEIYEVIQKVGPIRVTVLAVNILMVIYLVWRVYTDRKEAKWAKLQQKDVQW